MAKFTVAIDSTTLPGLAGPSCTRAEVTTYASQENVVERNLQQSRYATIDCYDAADTYLGRAYISSADTLGTAFRSGSLEGMLLNAFGG